MADSRHSGLASETHSQRELHLAWGVGAGRAHEVGWNLVIGREVVDSLPFSAKLELRGVAHRPVVCDLKSAVQVIR
jgi:hypothetical protein